MRNLREEAIDLIVQIYKKYPSGGALHIVIGDGNTEDHHIYWCIENSIKELENDKELFERCAICLMKLGTERRRDKAISGAWDRYVDCLPDY